MNPCDIIIIGGGTAGCILANRLTASGRLRVLLLEAGGEPSGMWIRIPAGFSKLLADPTFNWRFESEPEDGTMHRAIPIPRGKGLGGSTLINGMIYVRGQPQDYDRWEAAGARGWSAADVEPYFRKLENYPPGNDRRGHDGPMHLHRVSERFALADAFLQAAVEDGQLLTDDYNLAQQEGFGYFQVSQYRGRRWSVVDGYLTPARTRPNLRVETHAAALRLELDGRRCTGVTYRQGDREVTVRANLDVIVAAGAVQTPQLLELSGIGRPSLLQSIGVSVRHAQGGVGENYIDHFTTRLTWRVKNAVTLNEMARGLRLGSAVAQYAARRTGILSLGTGLVGGFLKTRPELATPDVQVFFMPASFANAAVRTLDREPGMTLVVMPLRPESMGSIHARSPDASVAPSIRPNFLATEEDRTCLLRGMQAGRRLMSRPAMQQYVDHETSPGGDVATDEQWLAFARANGQTAFHPLGTCRMGDDDQAVVDSRLRVRRLAGLRVVDASVMPKMVSGNIQAAVMMVAEKAADHILEDATQLAG